MKDENNPNIISLERSLGGSRSEFSTGFQAESVTPFDDVAIPRRPHIVPGLLTRKQLTILVGPPGASKSTFAAQAAIAIATGVEWGGFENAEQCKGLIIAKEEDGDEHNRRIAAFLQIMNKSQVEIENQLFRATEEQCAKFTVTKAENDGTIIAAPVVAMLCEYIQDNKIGFVIVDPFAETMEGDENATADMKRTAMIYRDQIARPTNAALMLIHHTPKYAKGMAGDMDASRGSGTLVGVARNVTTLFPAKEADQSILGCKQDEVFKYVRVDGAKANQTLITGQAKWFEKKSITIANGDEVGALKPIKPKGILGRFSVQKLREALVELERGFQIEEKGQTFRIYYSDHGNSKKRHPFEKIQTILHCNIDEAKAVIKEWIKQGIIFVEDYRNEQRRENEKRLKTDPDKWPGEDEK